MVHLEKYLLCHIFRLRREPLTQDRNSKPKHRVAVTMNEFGKSLLVAALCAGHKL